MAGVGTEVTLPDGTTVVTDGCTGFPDRIGSHDFSTCCAIHDKGGSNGDLLDCLNATTGDSYGWGILFALCIVLMMIFRPVYEWLIKIGVIKWSDQK